MEDCKSKKFRGQLVSEFTYDNETGEIVIVRDEVNTWCDECDTPLWDDESIYQTLEASLERFLHRSLKTDGNALTGGAETKLSH